MRVFFLGLVAFAVFSINLFKFKASWIAKLAPEEILNKVRWGPKVDHEVLHDECGVECVEKHFDDSPPDEYLIHTPACAIPNFPADHPSVAKYRRKEPIKVNCSSRDLLTEDDDDRNLYIRLDRLEQYGVDSWKNLNCSYQGIFRVNQDPNNYNGNSDRGRKLKESIRITQEVTPILDEDAILVSCRVMNDTKNRYVYRNVHYFIQPKVYQEKMKLYQKAVDGMNPTTKKRMNVLVYGKDAVSRANFLRHMPKTYEYLMSIGALDFKGFNKVAHNTFPNIITTVLGFPYWELPVNGSCCPTTKHKLDDCPFFFKNYSRKNYVTYFLEDAPWMGTYRYARTGFVEQPTDIYNSPFAYMSDDVIGHNAGLKGLNGKICQGGTLTTKILLDYIIKINKALKDKVPYCGWVWDAALTHDSLTMASASDEPTLKGLRTLKEGGYLDDTFMIIMADHGINYGAIRTTYAGVLEERLPTFIVVPPPWFKEKHPDAYKNLKTNTRRLVSNLDLYATLHDLHAFGYIDPSKSFVGKRYGQSLFKEVPLNRTCEDIAISPHYCACQDAKEVPANDPVLLQVANFSINHINEGLKKFPQCVPLTLDKVMYGRVSVPSNGTNPTKESTVTKKYLVMFTAKPSGAQLESSVYHTNGNFKLLSDISRINAYKGQSDCVKDFIYRMYCYCKDLL